MINQGTFHDLLVKRIPKIGGQGVFSRAHFKRGELLVRYMGQTITRAEGDAREEARRKGARTESPSQTG